MPYKVGFVGFRGMVGSVLMDRMKEENDFQMFDLDLFSTTQAGNTHPLLPEGRLIMDARDIHFLKMMDIIVTCQGSDWTKEFYPKLRADGWHGFWIDASSALRMEKDSTIVLDPVNRHVIDQALKDGKKDFIGGNCTVSLMLMALSGLFKKNLVQFVISDTYQAASGAGAANMIELAQQNAFIAERIAPLLKTDRINALELEKAITSALRDPEMPKENFDAPLAYNLLPFIDAMQLNGQTKEEWKGTAETNKILHKNKIIAVEGTCVRTTSMRCHSQALTIKLTQKIGDIAYVEQCILAGNKWVCSIPNEKITTVNYLTPVAVSGDLKIHIGRLRQSILGANFIHAFTVGDQLLWGAAEPIRRMLKILLERLYS